MSINIRNNIQHEINKMKKNIRKNAEKIRVLENEIDELKKDPDDGYDAMPVEIFNNKTIRSKSPVSIADIKRIHSISNGGSFL